MRLDRVVSWISLAQFAVYQLDFMMGRVVGAPGVFDLDFAPATLGQARGYRYGASSGAAGDGFSRAALPDSHAQSVAGGRLEDLGEFHVHASWK